MSMIITKSQRKLNAKADRSAIVSTPSFDAKANAKADAKSEVKSSPIVHAMHKANARKLNECLAREALAVGEARKTAMQTFTELAHNAGKITREVLKSEYEPAVKEALAASGVGEKSVSPMASTYLSAFLAIAHGCDVGDYTSITKFATNVARPYLRDNNLAPKNGRVVGSASHNEPKGEKGEKSAKDKGDVELMDESFRVVLAKFGGDKHARAWRMNALAAIVETKGAGKLFDMYLSDMLDKLDISLSDE